MDSPLTIAADEEFTTLRAWESALVPAVARQITFSGPGAALLVRVDPDLAELRSDAEAAGIVAGVLDGFFRQFSGVSAPA